MAIAVRFRAAVSLLGRFPALAGVDLEVASGEVVLVRGPNGAGKTTLLRACAGLVSIVDGDAMVLGHDLRRDRRAVRRLVGLVGHAGFLYDDLTVDEMVRFAARAAALPTAAADDVIARLGLGGRLRGLQVGRLSAGQRRRAAIAVAAVRRPQLWLLDEPHAGLDAGAREQVDELIRDAASSGAAVLVASHEVDRAESLADRVVTMAGGRIRSARPAGTREPAGVA